ncbi:MAG: TVP38/TMEM64 family protein, partial [Clostridiales bacterium]|nr:TVP38/TMEM64 family protein [Clostridiales bacterium]
MDTSIYLPSGAQIPAIIIRIFLEKAEKRSIMGWIGGDGRMEDRKLFRKRAMVIALLLALAGLGVYAYMRIGAPLMEMVSDTERLRAWVQEKGWWSRVIYGAFVALQVIVAPIPGGALEIAAGYAFGTLEGTLICLAGIFAASVLIFAVVRRFGRRVVRLFFSEEKIDSL